jgi:hypothetical protein
MSNKNQTNTYLDTQGVNKYITYTSASSSNVINTNSLNTTNILETLNRTPVTSTLNLNQLNTLTDSKNFNNPLKYELVTKGTKSYLPAGNKVNNLSDLHEFERFNNALSSTFEDSNKAVNYTFEDLKSGNQSLLSTERTVRLTDKLNPQKNLNTEVGLSNISNPQQVFNVSNTSNSNYEDLNRFVSTSTTFPLGHAPVLSSNASVRNLSFDRTFSENIGPSLLQSKEESAPNIVFETY